MSFCWQSPTPRVEILGLVVVIFFCCCQIRFVNNEETIHERNWTIHLIQKLQIEENSEKAPSRVWRKPKQYINYTIYTTHTHSQCTHTHTAPSPATPNEYTNVHEVI